MDCGRMPKIVQAQWARLTRRTVDTHRAADAPKQGDHMLL